MKSARAVDEQLTKLKASGLSLMVIAWKIALMCVGWAYVFAARGEKCTPGNRRAFYSASHPTIKSKCKNFDGSGSCKGCKWYPDNERTLIFDCRGFIYWVLYKVFGWKLKGAGATSQWNTSSNWSSKGKIATIPNDTLVCLFQQSKDNKAKMAHTGFGYLGETCECQVGVQHKKKRESKWTHWAVPACLGLPPDPEPTPTPTPSKKKPTIKRGSSGKYVKECQNDLILLGYDVGPTGADGKFGKNTEKAVKAFQKDHKLKVDGIVGPATWAALDAAVAKLNEGSVG